MPVSATPVPLGLSLCPAGQYCPSGSASTQHLCPGGYYCPQGSKNPTPCPSGQYCPEGVSIPTDCGAGYYCPALAPSRIPCAPGNYCPGNTSASQTPCPGNTYSTAQSSSCSCISPENGTSTGTAPDCAVTCNPGFEMFDGQCYASTRPARLNYVTASGQYSITQTDYITYICPPCYSLNKSLCMFSKTCKPTCQAGYIINKDSVCTPCPPGQQSLNNKCVVADAGYFAVLGVEVACPAGTWSAPGATQCTLCPAGTYSVAIGATSQSTCLPCPAGTWSGTAGVTSCTPCQSGTYSTTTGRTTACSSLCKTSCSTGQYMTAVCSAWADMQCSTCSTPTSGQQYTTAVCGTTTDTQFGTFPVCNPGYYITGSSSGTYSTLGVAGTCTACTLPTSGSAQYVTALCGRFTNTGITTRTACAVGQYISGFSQGSYNQLGVAGTCTNCSFPTQGTAEYVSTVCGLTTNTVITTKSCPTDQYAYNFSQGSYSTLGSAGDCSTCKTPTTDEYVTAACVTQANTQVGTKPVCTSSQYLRGFISGTSSTLGSSGTCTACAVPASGTAQYVSTVCGLMSNTVITTKTCSTGQYASGFSQGSYSQLGVAGTCTNCSAPASGTYVTAVCTLLRNTQTATKPVCTSSQYLSGFSSGTSSTLGSSGTCTTCSEPSGGSQYVTSVCTRAINTSIVQQSCGYNQYISGLVPGSSTTIGSAGTCTNCTVSAWSVCSRECNGTRTRTNTGGAGCIGTETAACSPNCLVKLYSGCGFGGDRQGYVYPPGTYNSSSQWQAAGGAVSNDDLRSIRVPSGLKVTLAQDINLGGANWTLRGSVASEKNRDFCATDGWWMDRASSLRIDYE